LPEFNFETSILKVIYLLGMQLMLLLRLLLFNGKPLCSRLLVMPGLWLLHRF